MRTFGSTRTWFAACLLLAALPLLSPAIAQPGGDALLRDPLISAPPSWERASDENEGFEARGLLRARSQAVIASEIAGRIVDMPFREGDRFAQGDILARFDCAVFEAQRAGAEAAERFARRQLEQKRELVRLRSAGEIEVGLAEARVEEAVAQTALQTALAERCEVRAPFAGAVVERHANVGESRTPGADLIEIIDDSDLEIRVLAPSSWLSWLAPGQAFTFHLEEAGPGIAARVEGIGASVDAASQTILVRGRFAGEPGAVAPGMSGGARFAPRGAAR